ncbi:MAG: UDP-N-acetylmuramoyl-tripeptide--D-alanyl-D-alanine ligase [Chloroflexota bacterium]
MKLTQGHVLASLTEYNPLLNTTPIRAVQIDSREVEAGDLFVAFQGERVDGHAYVNQAYKNGAQVALVEKPVALDDASIPTINVNETLPTKLSAPFCLLVDNTEKRLQQVASYWRDQFPNLTVIGITGSIGKTSTKELVNSVLSYQFETHKTPKNYNNEIGLPLTVLQIDGSKSHAVLEMGMYAKGEIALLCEIAKPQIGMVTNIGPVHLSRLGSIEAIVEAKRELVEALPADGVAILNRDDERVMNMAPFTKAQIFTYGLSKEADLWADRVISRGLEGIKFFLHYQGRSWRVHVPLLGEHSVHTSLRAAAVGLACGMEMNDIVAGLQSSPNQVRLITVRGPKNSLIIDDTYNASPDSVIAALNLLNDLEGRRIAVLGDMLELGSEELKGHKLVGRRASTVADYLVTIGPLGKIIGEEALNVGMPPDQVYMFDETDSAAKHLETHIKKGDIILIKGSLGMQMDRIVWQLSRAKGKV